MSGVVIVDAGLGNVGSLKNMCRRLGTRALLSDLPDDIAAADRVFLPGVGSFDEGMRRLRDRGLVEPLEAARENGASIMGICLGMQMMTKGSEEGTAPGLGWFDAVTVRFPSESVVRVPHMGWNAAEPVSRVSIFSDIPDDPHTRYYFVHSFFVRCNDESDVLATSEYGVRFVSAIRRGSVVATQFHPEKSHRYGMHVVGRFLEGA